MKYHNYVFFDSRESVYGVAAKDLKNYKIDFAAIIKKEKNVLTYGYSTLGMKPDCRFMLWFQSDEPEKIQKHLITLLHSKLGAYVKITHTLFGMVRPSQYGRKDGPEKDKQIISETKRERYLIVYPFTKTIEWHLMDFDSRKKIMIEHMKTGHKFVPIKQQLLYAYGVDDHEFVVSYETESLANFQSLVMELRGTEGRRYTKNDLPIFTCVHHSFPEVLDVV